MSETSLPPSAATRFSRVCAAAVIALALLLGIAVVFIPAWVMQPYQPQSDFALSLTYFLRRRGALLTTAATVAAATAAFYLWRATQLKGWQKAACLLAVGLTLLTASLSRMDRFMQRFDPLHRPDYVAADQTNFVGESDMVVSVTIPGEPIAAAYPVRQIAHHHLVQDVVGDTPLIVTYCSLCHTAMVWKAMLDGRRLTFGIAGIKNQNTLLRDEETGSWWQQATGEAIRGPLRGRRLQPVFSEELTFAVWKRENPGGKVLQPEDSAAQAGRYFPANWEEWVGTLPTVATPQPAELHTAGAPPAALPPLPPRTLIVGVTVAGGASKAYPLSLVRERGIINDTVGNVPVALVRGPDGKSVRAFVRPAKRARDNPSPLAVKEPSDPQAFRITSSSSGKEWNFAGKGVAAAASAAAPAAPPARLSPLPVLTEYWFNWKTHHPRTTLYGDAAP